MLDALAGVNQGEVWFPQASASGGNVATVVMILNERSFDVGPVNLLLTVKPIIFYGSKWKVQYCPYHKDSFMLTNPGLIKGISL